MKIRELHKLPFLCCCLMVLQLYLQHTLWLLEANITLFLISMAISFMLAAILFIFPSFINKVSSPNGYLAVCYFLIGIVLFENILVVTGAIESFPHAYHTVHIAVYLLQPLPYLYIRTVLGRPLRSWWNILHVAPAFIYVIDIFPFLILPASEKLLVIREHQEQMNLVMVYAEGFFIPVGFHVYFSAILFSGYVFAQIYSLWAARRDFGKAFISENLSWYRWLLFFTASELITLLPIVFMVLFRTRFHSADMWYQSAVLFSMMTIVSSVYLFFRPEILYGVKGVFVNDETLPEADQEAENSTSEQVSESRDERYISLEELEKISQTLDRLIAEQLPFLRSNYSMYDMANDTGLPRKMISAYLNLYLKQTFHDFMNMHRVEYLIGLMTDAANSHLTLYALAERAGFGNRTSFINAFKKFKGETPSVFLKILNGDIRDFSEADSEAAAE